MKITIELNELFFKTILKKTFVFLVSLISLLTIGLIFAIAFYFMRFFKLWFNMSEKEKKNRKEYHIEGEFNPLEYVIGKNN